ncbi:hypothetical protein TELCIR_02825 [Teladorsagia circumcincta]|uniref:Uncharacterized protein n=1 Tax=Teladorsagia circumcincta TaxID=45464 RepID=A0A2G9UY34_TELCI|nr:hypothetical protein TELCIR_02825 [Teladorsagia circumcincta]
MPALLTDLVISMDDRFAYVAGWLHGCIWQLDISDPFRTSVQNVVILGGLLGGATDALVKSPAIFQGTKTDIHFRKGGQIVRVDIDQTMEVSKKFLIDLKDMEGGPYMARDLRFFTGDSTSDNFL